MSLTDQYRQMHAAGYFTGMSTMDWADDIGAMLKAHDCRTVLDYGCGKGLQYKQAKVHEKWGVPMPTLYDPGVPEADEYPASKHDAVICCDVLEHLEGNDLRLAVKNCLEAASKAVFLAVSCRPARKSLPDGRNCHLTIQPPTWWQGYIEALRSGDPQPAVYTRFETGGTSSPPSAEPTP